MFGSTATEALFLLARVLFGGTLALMGLNHFMDTDSMTQYATFKGLPAPKLAVLVSGGVLVLGGLSIILGVLAGPGATLLAGFLVVSALTMHDFWTMEGEDAQNEMTHFLKNLFGAAGALAFAALATVPWPYALNIGL